MDQLVSEEGQVEVPPDYPTEQFEQLIGEHDGFVGEEVIIAYYDEEGVSRQQANEIERQLSSLQEDLIALCVLFRSLIMPLYVLFSLVATYFGTAALNELIFTNLIGCLGRAHPSTDQYACRPRLTLLLVRFTASFRSGGGNASRSIWWPL